MKTKKRISAKEFDRKFDNGEDISAYLDYSKVMTKEEFLAHRVNVDLPGWAVSELDREARRVGVSRQAIIKTWLVQKLDALKFNLKAA